MGEGEAQGELCVFVCVCVDIFNDLLCFNKLESDDKMGKHTFVCFHPHC